jgi:hypothetical protein
MVGDGMRVVHGRVERGQLVLDELLPEGAEVTVVIATGDDGFVLDEQQIAALRASLDEADRGEFVALEDVLAS